MHEDIGPVSELGLEVARGAVHHAPRRELRLVRAVDLLACAATDGRALPIKFHRKTITLAATLQEELMRQFVLY